MDTVTANGWKNKGGTSGRSCKCATWKQHWVNCIGEDWPKICSVEGCNNEATHGGHVINSKVEGEKIAPMCASCNNPQNTKEFNLKYGITLASANKSQSCEQ